MGAELTLQTDVAAKYDLVKVSPGIYDFPGYGQIDLTKLTLKSADQLVMRGFVWLVLKPIAVPDPKIKPQINSTSPAAEAVQGAGEADSTPDPDKEPAAAADKQKAE